MKALAFAALVAASPAVAQTECILTPDAYASLTDTYGEQRLQILVMPDGRIVETWGNPDTGSWSLFITDPRGISCPLGSGVEFQTFAAEPNA